MAARQRQWVEREANIITTNSELFGATNVNSGNSVWQAEYPGGITFPSSAKNLTLDVPQAALWYTAHLIEAGGPNKIYVNLSSGVPASITIDFAPGLWSLRDMNTEIALQLAKKTNSTAAANYFSLEGIPSTGHTRFVFNQPAITVYITIDFSAADSLFKLLGFDQGDIVNNNDIWPTFPAGYYPQTTISPNIATFDENGSFLLQTSLCGGRGIPVNSTAGNVVAQIIPDVEAGALIVYRPPQPPKVDVQHLAGKTVNTIHFQLTNEKGRELTFSSEVSTFGLRFRWLEPIGAPDLL